MFTSGSAADEDYVDSFNIATNPERGTPTLNGNADVGIWGSLSQIIGGVGQVANTVKGVVSKPKATTNIVSQKPLGSSFGISNKMLIYIGGGIVALVVLVLVLKRK